MRICLNYLNDTLFLYRVSVGADILFCKDGCTAVIDTGSSYITGPASSISILMKTIGAIELAEGGVNSVYLRLQTFLKNLSSCKSVHIIWL